jgi:hypothetical protein
MLEIYQEAAPAMLQVQMAAMMFCYANRFGLT